MRCMLCERLSLSHLCISCQESYLTPSLHTKTIASHVKVHAFYNYSDIEALLHTKHTPLGFYIYSILARLAFKTFAEHFVWEMPVASLSIDDHTRSGYSHTAILNRALHNKTIQPYYGKMRAQNRVSYSGKSHAFRLNNPRDFTFLHVNEQQIILVDDIVTTGTTLSEAAHCIYKAEKEVLFCLALAHVE